MYVAAIELYVVALGESAAGLATPLGRLTEPSSSIRLLLLLSGNPIPLKATGGHPAAQRSSQAGSRSHGALLKQPA